MFITNNIKKEFPRRCCHKNNENVGKEWNKFVLLPKIKNDQKARGNNFQKHKLTLKIGLNIINVKFNYSKFISISFFI